MGDYVSNQERKVCSNCDKNRKRSDFYNSNNTLFDGKSPICKPCIRTMIDVNDIETVYKTLKLLDAPFIYDEWEGAMEKGGDVFGKYMRRVNSLHNHRNKTWKDSIFKKEAIAVDEKDLKVISPDSGFVANQEMVEFWGSGYSNEEYKKLSIFYKDMENSYEIETASHKDYLKKICIVSLKMEQALADNQINQFKALSDVYDKLMRSAKFTAVQRSAADRTGGMNTFSEFFEFIEKEGFIPRFHTDEPKDIVDETIDNLMKYTRNLILGDPNIGVLVETALSKINENENEEDANETNEPLYDEEVDLNDY